MKCLLIFTLLFWVNQSFGNQILIPMDDKQANHLKAYGVAYSVLKADKEVEWLLNYRGGSFMMEQTASAQRECAVRGVSFEVISDATAERLRKELSNQNANMDVVKLHQAAKIVVYSPIKISKSEFEDTDAVLLVLRYAEIPFEVVYDAEIVKGDLSKYDWLHLHHEDFTGQFGKNIRRMSQADMDAQTGMAKRLGYEKVSQMKLDVAKTIKAFCAGGGYLFAMCSGAETFDVALAADGIDIVGSMFDGDGEDPDAQNKLNFDNTLAFSNFTLSQETAFGGRGRGFSDINVSGSWGGGRGGWSSDEERLPTFFSLFDFSAKWDAIPAMLTQNHEKIIKDFMGQTNSFNKKTVKSNVLVMGTHKNFDKYIYGEIGRGQFVFYGGHDPEGNQSGGFNRMPTDLNLHPHSPGYRLILNNVLFPSAKKKKRKT